MPSLYCIASAFSISESIDQNIDVGTADVDAGTWCEDLEAEGVGVDP